MMSSGMGYVRWWLWSMRNKWTEWEHTEDGFSTVELILILVGILTPYYGVGIRCIE